MICVQVDTGRIMQKNAWNFLRGVHRQQVQSPHTTSPYQAERETWNDNPDRQLERVQHPNSTWLHSLCGEPPTGIRRPDQRSSYHVSAHVSACGFTRRNTFYEDTGEQDQIPPPWQWPSVSFCGYEDTT